MGFIYVYRLTSLTNRDIQSTYRVKSVKRTHSHTQYKHLTYILPFDFGNFSSSTKKETFLRPSKYETSFSFELLRSCSLIYRVHQRLSLEV